MVKVGVFACKALYLRHGKEYPEVPEDLRYCCCMFIVADIYYTIFVSRNDGDSNKLFVTGIFMDVKSNEKETGLW